MGVEAGGARVIDSGMSPLNAIDLLAPTLSKGLHSTSQDISHQQLPF